MKSLIHIFNIIICLVLSASCYFSDPYGKIKFPEQFPFKNYYLLSTNIPKSNRNTSREKRENMDTSRCINLRIANNSYEMCFTSYELSNNALVNSNTTFIIYNNKSTNQYNLNQLNMKFTKGYIRSKPYTSTFSGYIHDNKLYGKMELDSKTFYIEPLDKFPSINIPSHNKNAIMYEVPTNKTGPILSNIRVQHTLRNRRQKRHIKNPGKLCSLLILIDNSFLRKIGKNNIKLAITTVLHSLDLSNALFRSTDFDDDGVPDNIGFTIRYVIVLESEDTGMNKLPLYSKKPISGLIYLFFFSQYELLGEVCLGAAFSAQPFLRRVLGLSYTGDKDDVYYSASTNNTGGICERPSRKDGEGNFNNMVITYRLENDESVPQITSDLSLAHELGHSFGSDHDSTKECLGYLMAPHTFNNTYGHNFLFSNCSKKKIAEIVEYKGNCLVSSTDPFCGNGLLEKNEECDCGLTFTCMRIDKCCVPRNAKGTPCTVNIEAGFQCHPSQGLCCKSNCRYQNISRLGLSCQGFDKRKCPCKDSNNNTCSCGVLGTCIDDECHSIECTRIGLTECSCKPSNYENKCITCCVGPTGVCLPAKLYTKEFAELSENNLESLKPYSVKNVLNATSATESFEVYCLGSKCVTLSFRSFKKGSFCLYKGGLGMCESNYVCSLNTNKWLRILDTRRSLMLNYANYVVKDQIFLLLSSLYLVSCL